MQQFRAYYDTWQRYSFLTWFLNKTVSFFSFQNKKATPEKKANGLLAEINNGRLAMIGIFGFLAADVVPGSVPLLEEIAIPYDGDIMAPLSDTDLSFLFPTA